VITGAGVSAASGVPTFRGADGLWKNFRAEALATPEAFARDPRLVWEWYDWRRQQIAACVPNAAHDVLAEWSRRFPHFRLITQNVDGLHERAGTPDVIRLHGSIWEVRCWSAFPALPPPCPYCGGTVRPGVVWFGEVLPADAVARAVDAADCDVFITAGTSAVVYPAAGFLELAKRQGAFTVEINPDITPATATVDLALRGPAEAVLAEVEAALNR
jgi:NAD-dependent deacetylase